jgi:N4-gp56 family major capsid protein
MAISDFNPEFWAASLIRHLDKAFVYAQPAVANRNYEGEIKQAGDTVHLQNVDDVTVETYDPTKDIELEEADTGDTATLTIDQFKYWAVKVDDLNKVQSHVQLMDEKTKRAAVAIADVVDQRIASHQAAVVTAGNVVEAAEEKAIEVKAAAEAYELLVDLGVQLDDQNVPTEGRFAVIPPWFHGVIQKDARFVQAGTAKTDEVLANGLIGRAAGFDLIKSNNVPNTAGADYRILAGSNQGITFAEQFVETEALRMERRFGDIARGLYIYGSTVANADELAVLRVTNKV